MASESRSANSIRNMVFSFMLSVMGIVLSMVGRTIFIHRLSAEYLGLNGLFSNILGILSLTELGIGNAMSYALYRPISDDDRGKICSLMHVYKRLYMMVGASMLLLGAALVPVLPFLIKEVPQNIPYLSLYFYLYVISMASSYFFSYKRTLIFCYQKEYILSILDGVFRIGMTLIQMAVIVLTGSYTAYLLVIIACNVSENVLISLLADKMYPFYKEYTPEKISDEDIASLKTNAVAIFFHKIGGVLAFSCDNIIISKFLGLIQIGLYSNYTTIITSVNSVLSRIITVTVPSIGNLMAGHDREHSEEIFYHILFFNAWLYGFACTCLLCLTQPFIKIWIGEDYLLPNSVVVIAVIHCYIDKMRLTLLSFKDASGVFAQDRFKPLIEGVTNVLISIPLAIKFGVSGVLMGTIISMLGIAVWYEALVFFRSVYDKGIGEYLMIQGKYLVTNSIMALMCFGLCHAVSMPGVVQNHHGNYQGNLVLFGIRFAICIVFPNVFYVLCFGRTEDFRYLKRTVGVALKRLMRR